MSALSRAPSSPRLSYFELFYYRCYFVTFFHKLIPTFSFQLFYLFFFEAQHYLFFSTTKHKALFTQLLYKLFRSFSDTTLLHSTPAKSLKVFHPDHTLAVTASCTPPSEDISKFEKFVTFSITSPSSVTFASSSASPAQTGHFLHTSITFDIWNNFSLLFYKQSSSSSKFGRFR